MKNKLIINMLYLIFFNIASFSQAQNTNMVILATNTDDSKIILLNQDGTSYTQQNILDTFADVYQASISPDGIHIALIRRFPTTSGYPIYQLFLYNRLTQTEVLIPNPEDYAWNPKWSPNGSQLAYHVGEFPDLYIYDMATQTSRLAVGGDIIEKTIFTRGYAPTYDWISETSLVVSLKGGLGDNPEAIYQFDMNSGKLSLVIEDLNNELSNPNFNDGKIFYRCNDDTICSINLATLDMPPSIVFSYLNHNIGDFDIFNNKIAVNLYNSGESLFKLAVYDINANDLQVLFTNSRTIYFSPQWVNTSILDSTPTPIPIACTHNVPASELTTCPNP